MSDQEKTDARKSAIAKAVKSARAGKRKSQSLDGKEEGLTDVHSIVEGIKAKRMMAEGGMVEDDQDFLSEDMPETEPEEEIIQDPEHEVEGEGEKRKKMIASALSKAHSK